MNNDSIVKFPRANEGDNRVACEYHVGAAVSAVRINAITEDMEIVKANETRIKHV
jgi:hypothetical protein